MHVCGTGEELTGRSTKQMEEEEMELKELTVAKSWVVFQVRLRSPSSFLESKQEPLYESDMI